MVNGFRELNCRLGGGGVSVGVVDGERAQGQEQRLLAGLRLAAQAQRIPSRRAEGARGASQGDAWQRIPHGACHMARNGSRRQAWVVVGVVRVAVAVFRHGGAVIQPHAQSQG